MNRACAGLVSFGLALLVAPAAHAFRTIEDYPEVPDGARVRWPNGIMEYWVYDHGVDSIDTSRLAEVARRAFLAWGGTSCARVVASELGISPRHAEPGDGMNTIEIINDDWEGLGFPSDAAGANDILFEEDADGSWAIVEADIYINAVNFRWSTATTPGDDERSLLGVLTHEGGHALGLLHPCEPDGADGAPVCGPDDAPDALMSPFYQADQERPDEDDRAAICYLYPRCELEGCGEGLKCEAGECVPIDPGGGVDCDRASGGQGGEPGGETCEPKRSIGVECSESNQCEGGECVAGVKSFPVCTQRCGEGEPACPHSWTCSNVEGRRVCLPPDQEAGCECAIGPGGASPRPSTSATSFFVAFGVILSAFFRARRRARRKARNFGVVGSPGIRRRVDVPQFVTRKSSWL